MYEGPCQYILTPFTWPWPGSSADQARTNARGPLPSSPSRRGLHTCMHASFLEVAGLYCLPLFLVLGEPGRREIILTGFC